MREVTDFHDRTIKTPERFRHRAGIVCVADFLYRYVAMVEIPEGAGGKKLFFWF